jgi:hypothetical protein
VHTFASVVFDYRLKTLQFYAAVIAVWIFIYAMAIIGVAMHPDDIYVRAVAWCWMNSKYQDLRLWLHYFWIFIFEFGTVFIYLAMYMTVHYRIKTNFYAANSLQARRARSAAKLMIAYPIIYVICTLPLATLRMVSMTSHGSISFGWFTFSGSMITSNGWLDVFLYTLTRRIMLFSDAPPPDSCGIEDTFSMPFSGSMSKRFGTKTTCEYSGKSRSAAFSNKGWFRGRDHSETQKRSAMNSFASTDQLFVDPTRMGSPQSRTPLSPDSGSPAGESPFSNLVNIAVQTHTTIDVHSEPIVELADMREVQAMKDSADMLSNSTHPVSDKSSIDFATKPDGWP